MQFILFVIWYLVVILPILIFQEGWEMFSKWMNRNRFIPMRLPESLPLPFVIVGIVIIILFVLMSIGD